MIYKQQRDIENWSFYSTLSSKPLQLYRKKVPYIYIDELNVIL